MRFSGFLFVLFCLVKVFCYCLVLQVRLNGCLYNKLHHGGKFIHNGTTWSYVGGSIGNLDVYSLDTFLYF